MLEIHYRQINRPMQPGGEHYTTAELNVMDCKTGKCYWFECSTPNVDKFIACGDWRKAVSYAIKRYGDKLEFFAKGFGSALPSAQRIADKCRRRLEQLTFIASTPGDDVNYAESFETFVVDYFGDEENDEPEEGK